MSAINKQLIGSDLCNYQCLDANSIIHPETNTNQILIGSSNVTIENWLGGGGFTGHNSMLSWLQENYPQGSYTLPTASASILGGIKVGNYLTINEGVLSVNVDSLNIPSVDTATFTQEGIIKLGNNTPLTSNFTASTITGQVHDSYNYNGHVYALPLRLDNNGRAGVIIPTGLFNGSGAKSLPNWTLDYSKKVTNVTLGTLTGGTSTNYILFGNKNVDTANGELGYDTGGNLSTNNGYPRMALVAGNGINLTRYTNKFISNADNYWGDNITEILLSVNEDAYSFLDENNHSEFGKYVIKGPGSNTAKYLKGDGTWNVISYTELSDTPSFAAFMIYKGTVANYAALENISNPEIGWVYNVTDTGMNYAWSGTAWDALGTNFSIDTLSSTQHASNTSYAIKGSGYDASTETPTKFLKEDGSWDTPTDTTYSVATANDLGLIKIGYTRDGNKKPVQLDANNKAYVDTEQHPTVGGMVTGGLSAHFFRVGTGSSAGSFTADKWIPIIISHSNNIGKCSVSFEIFGREDGKTSYGKYYANHMTNKTNSLLCTSFYSEDTNHFDYSDVRCANYAASDNDVTIIIYKKVRNVTDSMFIVNILAENSEFYSIQHYFYTGASSIADINYKLLNSDLRIGTYNNNDSTITARLENDGESTERTMPTIGATNATFYNPQ